MLAGPNGERGFHAFDIGCRGQLAGQKLLEALQIFADDLDDPTEVCTAVLKDSLAFPSGYKDGSYSQ